MNSRLRVAVTLSAVITLLLTGCAGPKPDFQFGGEQATQCVHLMKGEQVLIGETITSHQSPLTIESIGLSGESGIRIVKTWTIATGRGPALGVADVPPPSYIPWQARRSVKGSPFPAHSNLDLVLEVEKTTTKTAKATAMTVEVNQGGSLVGATGTTRYTFPAKCF